MRPRARSCDPAPRRTRGRCRVSPGPSQTGSLSHPDSGLISGRPSLCPMTPSGPNLGCNQCRLRAQMTDSAPRPPTRAPTVGRADERLVRRAKKGDRRAFEAIFERYHQDLYRFCLTMVGERQDAEDALQATMVKLLRALPGEAARYPAAAVDLPDRAQRVDRHHPAATRDGRGSFPSRSSAGPGLGETVGVPRAARQADRRPRRAARAAARGARDERAGRPRVRRDRPRRWRRRRTRRARPSTRRG